MTSGIRNDDSRIIVKFLETRFPKLSIDCTRQVTTGDFMVFMQYGFKDLACELTPYEFKHEDWQGKLDDEISTWLDRIAV